MVVLKTDRQQGSAYECSCEIVSTANVVKKIEEGERIPEDAQSLKAVFG